MKFAIALPQFTADGAFDPDAFGSYLRRAEELGFDSAWAQEAPLGTSPQLSPMETMTYAAACTERLRLGCVVFVTTLHSPVHLAKSLASLDQLSRGRIEIGVGTGGPRMFSAFGVDPDTYIARFNEGLSLMKELWTRPRVDFDGRFWQLSDAGMEPKPFQKPYPRIWFGANKPAALRRAVRRGGGFFGAGSTPTSEFVEQVPVVREALREEGRDAADFPVAKRIYVTVDDDAERARRRVNEGLERIYGRRSERIEAAAVSGPPARCAAALREVADAGAETVLFTPVDEQAEQMERLAAEVIPQYDARG